MRKRKQGSYIVNSGNDKYRVFFSYELDNGKMINEKEIRRVKL